MIFPNSSVITETNVFNLTIMQTDSNIIESVYINNNYLWVAGQGGQIFEIDILSPHLNYRKIA